MKSFSQYAIGSVSTLLIVVIAMYIGTFFTNRISDPLVHYEIVSLLDTGSLCPGDTPTHRVRADVLEPTVVDISIVFMNADGSNIVGLESVLGIRAFPFRTSFEEQIVWTVPNLPPGNYTRVTTATNRFADVRPQFVFVPFTVRNNCPKIPS